MPRVKGRYEPGVLTPRVGGRRTKSTTTASTRPRRRVRCARRTQGSARRRHSCSSCGLLRVSECAALRWADVALNPDESATAVIHRRKTKSTTTAYFAPATVAARLAAKVGDDEPRVARFYKTKA